MTERPAALWEGRSAAGWAAATGVPEVHLFQRVGSTNDVARRLAAAGAPSLALVLAEQQLAGRGRIGRSWASPPGLGLWLSLVYRPGDASDATTLPLVAGLAAADALDPFLAPAAAGVKWPNDLLVDGRKLGGVLCEGAWEAGRLASVVVGVGLNVLHELGDFPDEIRGSATSVRIASARAPRRAEVAEGVVRSLAAALAAGAALTPQRVEALRRRDALLGRPVVVTEPATGAELARGTALGVAPGGALLLRTERGAVREVVSGTVRLLTLAGAIALA